MPTYAENANARERAAVRVARNAEHKRMTRYFDAAAGEVRMKYERPSFAVVTASDAFREGWDRIFHPVKPLVDPAPAPDGNVEDDEDEG